MATDAEALLQVDIPIEDEVVQFVTDVQVYYLYTARGMRIDISRTLNYQPAIRDEQDFHTYMWVEARQGYFLLSQHFENGVAGRWTVHRELIPRDSSGFFLEFGDVLEQYIASLTVDR